MHSYDNRTAIEAAQTIQHEPRLHRLLIDRVELYREAGLLDLTHILAIETGDTEQAIVDAIGLSPLISPLDGERYGKADFQPCWDGPIWRHDGWFELIVTVGNDGFAFILLIADEPGMLPELLDMCRTYARA